MGKGNIQKYTVQLWFWSDHLISGKIPFQLDFKKNATQQYIPSYRY